jgi:hypothetical protein
MRPHGKDRYMIMHQSNAKLRLVPVGVRLKGTS